MPDTPAWAKSPESLIDALLEAALAVAAAVGDLTAADRLTPASAHPEQYLVDVLADRAARKVLLCHGFGVYSEESGATHLERELSVIVDPIDGSANCAAGRGPFGPSLCLVDAAGPLAAVVFDLASGTAFAAARGWGALRDGVRLPGTDRAPTGVLAVGDADGDWGPALAPRFTGASAHDLCAVAAGSADGYLDRDNTQAVWDYLAASLIITESGGVIIDRCGASLWRPESYGSRHRIAAAGSPALWPRISDLTAIVPTCPGNPQ